MSINTVVRLGDLSVGHAGFPPTQIISGCASTFFVNGLPIALDGAIFADHNDSHTTHSSRYGIASSNIYVEGKRVLRTGDAISCGDTVGPGSSDSFYQG
jgi:uncharacterized Zn-binding protein involved in type VI secretion